MPFQRRQNTLKQQMNSRTSTIPVYNIWNSSQAKTKTKTKWIRQKTLGLLGVREKITPIYNSNEDILAIQTQQSAI